jgi:branched-chain amino acid transport system substrate-binding protein
MAAVLVRLVGVTVGAVGGEQFIPILGYREGALKALGISMTNGFIDYVTLLNERDGGIHGVPLVWEECETVYDIDRGVECYERLKSKGSTGAAVVVPPGTPITYALLERATQDRIPLLTPGFGRSDASDGRVFPYVFTAPTNYWSLNTAKIRFIGQRAGGMDQLKGLKLAHVYIDSGYGRETLPILDQQAARYGFTVQHLAIKPPGLDQKATWLRVKVAQPDWVILRTAGVDTATALKEAAQVGIPATGSWGIGGPARSRMWCQPGRRPVASSARRFMPRGATSRSSRTSSPTCMPGAKGLGRKGRSAQCIGSGACCAAC